MKMPGGCDQQHAGLIQRTNEVHCTTLHPADHPPAAVILPPQPIELRGILVDGDQLHAVFVAGPAQRIVRVDRVDLITFAAFRRRVAENLRLQIEFVGDWSDAVAAAFAQGAAI
jgi:hypothetical protein